MNKVKVLIGILGIDQHEFGAITVAKCLRDSGMEVVYMGRFCLPDAIAASAVEEDVNIIGLSCHSWEYLYYLPGLMKSLADKKLGIPVVVGGSVVTQKDEESLKKLGVAAAFGPNSTTEEIIHTISGIAESKP